MILGEVLIPILGLVFYDWTIITVAIFFQLDLICACAISIYKGVKSNKAKKVKLKATQLLSLVASYILFISIISIVIYYLDISKFISLYKEFLIEEWAFIIFLPVFYYINLQMAFIMPRKHLTFSFTNDMYKKLIALGLSLFLIAGITYLKLNDFNDVLLVLIVVTFKLAYDMLMMKLGKYEIA
jgi:hypothetical protein